MNTLVNHALLTLSIHKGLALLASAFITSAAVICVAAAAAMALRHRSARSRSAVWRLALVAMLLVGAWRLMPDLPPPVAVMEWQVDLAPALQLDTTTVVELPLFELPQQSPWEKATAGFDAWAVRIWAGVAALWLCLRVFGVLFGLRSLKQRSSDASQRVLRLGIEAGLPARTSYRLVSSLVSPMLTGWRRPVIWLPAESASWDENRLRAVLRHEAAHWQRHDWLWQWLAQTVLCLWWWQPLAWLARRRLRIETEHAADDLAVSGAEHAPDYARTLVEIAAGMPSRLKSSLGMTMFGNEGVKQRVQALLKRNRWRGRIGMGALSVLAVVVVLLAVLAATQVEFVPRAPMYRSTAKLIASMQVTAYDGHPWQEQQQGYFDTIIAMLESSEMHRRAVDRALILNHDLKDQPVEVTAAQTKGSGLVNIVVTSADARYARIYLDALLDEFVSFRQFLREQIRDKGIKTLTQEVVKKQKEMEETNELLQSFKRENNLISITLANNQTAQMLGTLHTQREQVLTETADLELAVASPNQDRDKVLRNKALNRNLSEMEQIYLRTLGEIFVMKNERDYLLKSRKADHPEVVAMEEKMARANHLLESATQQIRQEMQDQLAALKRKAAVLDEQIKMMESRALDSGRKIAQHDMLKKRAEAATEAYQKLQEQVKAQRDKVESQSDFVAIMERATPSTIQPATSNMFPVWKLWTPKHPAEKHADAKKP